HTLTQTGEEASLAVQSYPEPDTSLISTDLEQDFDLLINAIRTIRNLRAEADIKPGVKIQTMLESENERERQILDKGKAYIQDLAKVEQLTIAQPEAIVPVVAEPPLVQLEPLSAEPHARSQSETYWKAATVSAFLITTVVVLKVLYAIFDTVNSLPLLPSLFQLIGFGWTTWFVARHLLWHDRRQDLAAQAQTVIFQVTGDIARSRGVTPPPLALPESQAIEVTSLPPSSLEPIAVPNQQIAGVVGTVQVLIPLAGVVDMEALQAKLQRDLAKVEAEVQSLSQRLSNRGFVDKAPKEVVEGVRNTLAEAQKQAEMLQERLKRL
ncbi:MAG TPA: CAAD domain-containing protein, partial [Allocoleopsis sp.]